jgi:uncharacterized protein
VNSTCSPFRARDGNQVSVTFRTDVPHTPDRLLSFAEARWNQPVTGLFFLAVNEDLPHAFVQALLALGFRPIPLQGAPQQKVVDIAIQRTLRALVDRAGDVMLASHDGDFVPDLAAVCGDRRVALIGFPEFRNRGFLALAERGVEFFDLEHEVKAFNVRLPRVRIIPIDEFDPLQFL